MRYIITAATAFAVIAGIALGFALRGTVMEAEAKPPSPEPPGPQAVEEQNVDGSGYIAVHEQGVADVNVVSMPSGSGGACYTNWNADTCAAGYTAVSTGVWTAVAGGDPAYPMSFGLICAAAKPDNTGSDLFARSDTAYGGGAEKTHGLSHEPCAICCK